MVGSQLKNGLVAQGAWLPRFPKERAKSRNPPFGVPAEVAVTSMEPRDRGMGDSRGVAFWGRWFSWCLMCEPIPR